MKVQLDSLNGNADVLVELAGALGAGRPDADLTRKGCMEALPEDVTREIRAFADFSADQYQDVVALLAALSTRLRGAGTTVLDTDRENAARIDTYLAGSVYVAPGRR
ncbi:MAG TPA: hypothetical protein VN408_40610 [Actinoplanes sp.]|nr:hypothetical protein [Actinoplanes sp.]